MKTNLPGTLYAGVARTDITPSGDCLLGGFAGRDHGCEGIHDPLYATSLALVADGKKFVMTGVDILGFTNEQMDRIWKLAREKLGLQPGQLFINASHTHAAPAIHPMFNHEITRPGQVLNPDPGYIDELIEKVILSAGNALKDLRPAVASRATGETFIGINRRASDKSIYKKEATGYENFPNPDREVDRTCPVILFKDQQDRPISLVFGAACHPTTMRYDNYLVSAEYPGAARNIIEKELGGAPSLFLQGMAGDVKPRQVAEGNTFRSGTFEDVEKVGAELAADVLSILRKGLQPFDVRIRTSLTRVSLPFDQKWDIKMYERYGRQEEAAYRQVWAGYWLEKLKRGEPKPDSTELTLSLAELSPGFRLAGVAGELLTDMGMKIKHLFDEGETLVFGYTNGEIAYITDAKTLREGGYEATETIFFSHDKPAPFDESIEEIILSGFKDLEKNIE